LMAGVGLESAIIGRFLSREIDRRKRAGVGFAVIQTGGDPTRNVSADRAPIGARDSKPEDSDSFRLTRYRRSHYSLEFAPRPISFAIRRPDEELAFLE
jgi:hypothetical protein